MAGPRRKLGRPYGENAELQDLGERLAEARRKQGRLQQEVAESAGVSRSTLHAIEHGAPGVRWEKVNAVLSLIHI